MNVESRKAVNVALDNVQSAAGKLLERVTHESQCKAVEKQLEELQGMMDNLRQELNLA